MPSLDAKWPITLLDTLKNRVNENPTVIPAVLFQSSSYQKIRRIGASEKQP